jgi:FMN phosphatase YigB (HAD superfamily)
VRLVVIDLIPALLSWEGRDRSSDPDVPPEAAHALDHVYSRFRIAGIADARESTADLRTHLEREDLAVYFDSVATCAEFGPAVSPRVVRRVVAAMGGPDDRTVFVTAREHLVASFGAARIPVVFTSQQDFAGVPIAVEELLDGRVNP